VHVDRTKFAILCQNLSVSIGSDTKIGIVIMEVICDLSNSDVVDGFE